MLVELLDPVDPLDVLQGGGLVLGLGNEVQRIDDVIGVELGAVVKFDALAQLDLEGLVVEPFPGGGKLSLVFAGSRIAIDERVPDLFGDDEAENTVLK